MEFVAYKGSVPLTLLCSSFEIFSCARDCKREHRNFFLLLSDEQPHPLPYPLRVVRGPLPPDEYVRRTYAVRDGALWLPDVQDGHYAATFQVKARDGFWRPDGTIHMLNNCVPCELRVRLLARAPPPPPPPPPTLWDRLVHEFRETFMTE